MGRTAYDLVSLCKERDQIDATVEVQFIHHLLHYARQANLQVSLEDKRQFIWPLQIGDRDKVTIRWINDKWVFE